jgi:hypothetical protein
MGNEMYPEVKDETNSSVIPGNNANNNVGSESDSSESTDDNDKTEDTNATE